MSLTALQSVRPAIQARFRDEVATPLGIPTSYPNATFRRDPAAPIWAQILFNPETSSRPASCKRRSRGALIVHLYTRRGDATKSVREVAQAVINAFRDADVGIARFSQPSHRDVGESPIGWWQQTVSCPFLYDEELP